MTDWTLEQLESALRLPLPGHRAQRLMEPPYSYGRHAGPPAPDARRASVAIVLHPGPDAAWQFPLTVRPSHMKDHAGQVCLPGGAREGDETFVQCALREVEEELAPIPGPLRVLGELSSLYVFGTNFHVAVVVLASHVALRFRPDPSEVSQVIPLTLSELLKAETRMAELPGHGLFGRAPAWEFGSCCCWGATAMILSEFREVLRRAAGSTGY